MQKRPRAEFERSKPRPSVSAWLERVRARKRASRIKVSSEEILKHRDADRR